MPLAAAALCPLLAQQPLTLEEAVRTAVRLHPAMQSAASNSNVAAARVTQARSGYLPRVTYSESFARSDNPVFVFSSLLTQRQFTTSNFAIDSLNRPDFLNHLQSTVGVEQSVYDWGSTSAQVRSAELNRTATEHAKRRTELDIVAGVVRAYFNAVLAKESLETARAALVSANADMTRAETVRKAGMSTDADVLSIRVHLAGIREAEIRRGYDAEVTMAALNEALGMPLDTQHTLQTPLVPIEITGHSIGDLEATAAGKRPETKLTALAADVYAQQRIAARSTLLPQVGVRGVFEADRPRFVNRGGANWLLAATVRWNLFDGNAARARMAEASAAETAARAQERQANAGVRLDVRKAWADLRSADERIAVTTAAVAQAEESLRINKNRYDAGLATVTDLLRTETALLETKNRRLAAIHDQRVAAAQLLLAAGTLTSDSEVLK